jgi:hypothetical protein
VCDLVDSLCAIGGGEIEAVVKDLPKNRLAVMTTLRLISLLISFHSSQCL